MTHRQLYLDCDGVLADFDQAAEKIFGGDPRTWEADRAFHIYDKMRADAADELDDLLVVQLRLEANRLAAGEFWEKLYAVENLFETFDVLPDANELVAAVKHLDPIILTGCPRGYWAVPQKLRWRDQHFPDLPMICVESINKNVHCRAGDALVDDWDKYRANWEGRGGTFVLHTSAQDSLEQLRVAGWDV